MKSFSFKRVAPVILCLALLSSCVPSRMYDDLQATNANCETENKKLRSENSSQKTKIDELQADNRTLNRDVNYLSADTTACGLANRRLTGLYNELTNSYEKLVANSDKFSQTSQEETKKMIRELQLTQEELFKNVDSLKRQEKALRESNEKLKLREAKVEELERILRSKDSAQVALRDNLTKALLGFNNNGLTILKKNGKVYVSMEERLLFASGSITVDPQGEAALKKLAEVLEKNNDINILIEGHTDNVPIKTGTMKDNWDLSVLRATSVVRMLTKYGNINPERLTPAGRGEFHPLDKANTADARKKNRRIEIILSPRMDELLELIDQGEN